MCGIHLIIDKNKSLKTACVQQMADATRYRGPDDTRIQVIEAMSADYHMASNRLMITDNSDAGAQPFMDADRHYALLFNGEIYNYPHLKNRLLEKGIRFRSHSDTEVLFHWLTQHGEKGITSLQGMFAFVFIDFRKNVVLAARDRFGIKPLYHYFDEKYAIFSSEIHGIFASGLVEKKLNKEQVTHYLSWKYAKSPWTFYENIYEVEHGTAVHLSHEKKTIIDFKKVEGAKQSPHHPESQTVGQLITDSLLKQLDAQVPLGLLLSGGTDSTLLLALAHKQGYTLPTFSIVNSEKDTAYGTKDYHFARLAAKTFQSEHHEIEAGIGMLDGFHDFIANMDQPIGDSAWLMTSEVSKNASKSMKILLSGAGADELFAGYNRHRAFYHYLKYRRLYDILHPFIRKFSKAIPAPLPHPLGKKIRLIKKWAKSHTDDPWQTWINYLIFNEFPVKIIASNDHKDPEKLFARALEHDRNNYLINDVLALSDRATMRHGIEMRVPYLDENLMEYLHGFDAIKLIDRGRKWILRDILKNNGGKKFAERSKEGFGLPFGKWLLDKRSGHLWGPLANDQSMIYEFVDKPMLDHIIMQHKQKREDHGPLLWSVMVLAHWLEHHFA